MRLDAFIDTMFLHFVLDLSTTPFHARMIGTPLPGTVTDSVTSCPSRARSNTGAIITPSRNASFPSLVHSPWVPLITPMVLPLNCTLMLPLSVTCKSIPLWMVSASPLQSPMSSHDKLNLSLHLCVNVTWCTPASRRDILRCLAFPM